MFFSLLCVFLGGGHKLLDFVCGVLVVGGGVSTRGGAASVFSIPTRLYWVPVTGWSRRRRGQGSQARWRVGGRPRARRSAIPINQASKMAKQIPTATASRVCAIPGLVEVSVDARGIVHGWSPAHRWFFLWIWQARQ